MLHFPSRDADTTFGMAQSNTEPVTGMVESAAPENRLNLDAIDVQHSITIQNGTLLVLSLLSYPIIEFQSLNLLINVRQPRLNF